MPRDDLATTTAKRKRLEGERHSLENELQKVIKWLRKGGDTDAQCQCTDGRTQSLLHMAAYHGQLAVVQGELENTLQELRAAEGLNMQLQKKINKLQVEHVSEEEVDQLVGAVVGNLQAHRSSIVSPMQLALERGE